MTAISIDPDRRGAEALQPTTIALPQPGAGEILIRVAGAGVNRPDLIQRDGGYPPPPGAPETLGLEVSGTVAALGGGAERWRVGDEVVALLAGGGYAEYVTVDERHALPRPPAIDLIDAAALPETVFTVWTNLFERGALKPGETVLIHGGSVKPNAPVGRAPALR
ncbi:MAG: alcohol dehydrogenase catalytic domain-containing protein [Novosphingobium sp.]